MKELKHKKVVLCIILVVIFISTFILVKNKDTSTKANTLQIQEGVTIDNSDDQGSKLYIDLKGYSDPIKKVD